MNNQEFKIYKNAIKDLRELIGDKLFKDWWEEMVMGPRREKALANKE